MYAFVGDFLFVASIVNGQLIDHHGGFDHGGQISLHHLFQLVVLFFEDISWLVVE